MKVIKEHIAVISDVHGNSLALKAVLDDIESRGIGRVLNLGDSLYGPLDPVGTADIIIDRKIPSVLGNEDRLLLESSSTGDDEAREPVGNKGINVDVRNPSLQYTLSHVTDEHLDWLWSLPQETQLDEELYLCHASPSDDTNYLLWEIRESGAQRRSDGEILERLGGITASVILCGHDHLQTDRRLPGGRLIVDPGSVGLQAYTDDMPYPHAMEAGSPHARYSILHRSKGSWLVEHRSIIYDWESASRTSAENGRPDWAQWLITGRAET